jgi:hypothetical protein
MGDLRMGIPQAYVDNAPPTKLRPETTEATRYLCAAAHLDEVFARAVLDEVLYQPRRAIAPSHSMSLGPVIRHALAARRRTLIRDAVVAGTLVLGLAVSFTTGLIVVLSLLWIWLITRIPRLVAARRTTTVVVYLIIALFFVPTLQVLIASTSLLQYGLYGLSYYSFAEAYTALGRVAMWLLLLLLIWATSFAYRLIVHHTIASELTLEFYDPRRAPAAGPVHEQHLKYIEHAQQGNVTVYSRVPFIGFGVVTQKWSLVTPLRPAASLVSKLLDTATGDGFPAVSMPPSDAASVIPFTIDQLYEAFRAGMAGLSDPRLSPDEVVPNLSVRDRVFLAGTLPINSPYLEHGYPRYRLSDSEIKEVQRNPRGRLRHYLGVRMAAWDGELEVTTFIHASQRGGMLFVEFVGTVMPGILSTYHRIDTYDRLDAVAILRAAGRAIGDVIRSPVAVVALAAAGAAALRRALNDSSETKRISRQLMFDYGCRSSVREFAADFDTPTRFQLYDADERVSLVGRRLLQVMVRFLEEHHYDVTDLADQAATVINNTRINNGNNFFNSTVNNSAIVAGNSASATVTGGTQVAASSAAASRSI